LQEISGIASCADLIDYIKSLTGTWYHCAIINDCGKIKATSTVYRLAGSIANVISSRDTGGA
jgi:hypothetical protein